MIFFMLGGYVMLILTDMVLDRIWIRNALLDHWCDTSQYR